MNTLEATATEAANTTGLNLTWDGAAEAWQVLNPTTGHRFTVTLIEVDAVPDGTDTERLIEVLAAKNARAA